MFPLSIQKQLLALYAWINAKGLLNTVVGKKLFHAAYFFYKRYIEDSLAALGKQHPDLFKGGHILDVGANIGYTATALSRFCDADARILAVEPEPENFRALKQRVKNNHHIIPLASAVGVTDGTVDLWLNEKHHADHRIVTTDFSAKIQGEACVTVPLRSIDSLVAEHQLHPITLIKIDVQGFEHQVCLGMTQTLKDNPNISIILEYSVDSITALGFNPTDLLEWIHNNTFHVYTILKNGTLQAGLPEPLPPYCDLLLSRHAQL